MPVPPIPENESDRLRSLRALEILDTPAEERFDRLTRLAVAFTGCQVSTITLVDEDRQWFKSETGQRVSETPRSMSFCAYAILEPGPTVVEDATADARFADNPLVTGAPEIRAYAGVPLVSGDGMRLGSLCVIDPKPRTFTPESLASLQILAEMAVEEMGKVELNRLVKDLQSARAEADRANQTKSDFLAMMSHEIRTPLNGVIGFSDLLLAKELSGEFQEYAAGIRASAETLRILINDLLDFSKIEAGRLDLEYRPTSIHEETQMVWHMFDAIAAEKGLSFECVIDTGVPVWVHTDPTRYRQILCNLLSNAIKFTAHGLVRVHVDYDAEESMLRVRVEDSGMGISQEDGEKLFQPFTQADSSTSRRFGGTGLGLAICRQLCTLLGGTIHFDSVSGQGTTFCFSLRAQEVVGESPAMPEKSQAGPVEAPPLRVLAAEDNILNRRVLELTLKKLKCHCDLVSNGLEVLERLEMDRGYDLILMDVRMPEMDGLETTRQIRLREQNENLPRLPVVAFTADVQASDRQACIEAGMDEVLTKPLNADQLLRTLHNLAGVA